MDSSTQVLTQHVLPGALLDMQYQKTLRTDIILGSPSMRCQGVGICRVMAHRELFTGICPKVSAWLTVTKTGKLRVSFLKVDMDSKYVEKHFEWMIFQVQEPYQLPGEMMRELGLTKTIVQPGVYPVLDANGFFTVEF